VDGRAIDYRRYGFKSIRVDLSHYETAQRSISDSDARWLACNRCRSEICSVSRDTDLGARRLLCAAAGHSNFCHDSGCHGKRAGGRILLDTWIHSPWSLIYLLAVDPDSRDLLPRDAELRLSHHALSGRCY